MSSPQADASALQPGHRVLEYRIDKILGGGGFGITYLAHDVNLDTPIALKEYFPNDLAVRGTDHSVSMRSGNSREQYDWGLERFLDEARALASFRHPNIVRVLRYFRENNTAYIVMEYESGDPLKRWMARQTSFDQKSLLRVVYPLLDGLEAVHKTNFLHRDIKPDNIYIRADGTPVLLDFGAARRVTAGNDLTNVVSPGFAPFEQYHSRGNQGPWTDIYSLGAVMYWMCTGSKPMESASRIKEDTMAPALQFADILTYGDGLLRAIDWAMSPDETKRPQSVPEFRKALAESEDAAITVVAGGLTQPMTRAAPGGDSRPMAPTGPSAPGGITPDSMRRNVMATILFLDLVGYSTHLVTQQVTLKKQFNDLLTKTLRGIDESSRIIVDTGDGAAVCFLGDPEEALQSALLIRDLLVQKYRGAMQMRIGLHLGPVRVVADINERTNVVGDGINVAQRIMDFAQPNQIVVSRAYYDVISRIADNTSGLFRHLGPHLDKHLRSHDIYAVLDPNAQPAQGKTLPTDYDRTSPHLEPVHVPSPQAVAEIEAELLRLIGPLARVLVRKAAPRAGTALALREALAASIPDATARDAFANPKHGISRSTGNSASQPPSFSRPSPSQPGSQPPNASVTRPLTQPPTSRPSPGSFTQPGPASQPLISNRLRELTPEHLAQFERALSLHIGPMAKMLVKKEVARNTGYDALLNALAAHIDKPAEREKFLSAHRTPKR